MTQDRKDELYGRMMEWICERIKSDEDLYPAMQEYFGMTEDELHDCGIESPDETFPVDEPEKPTRTMRRNSGSPSSREAWN